MTYAPKRDLWVQVVLLLISSGFLVVACLLLAKYFATHEPFLWVPALLFGAVGAFTGSIILGTRYEITETDVVIRMGPVGWSLPLEGIEEVSSAKRWRIDFDWNTALSNDRLRIKCRGRLVGFWVSPDDKQAFVAELVGRRPEIRVVTD